MRAISNKKSRTEQARKGSMSSKKRMEVMRQYRTAMLVFLFYEFVRLVDWCSCLY
jgi:hypothetical protein